MNIYEKLLKARVKFLEANIKKSGKNYGIGYSYFELKDIVPTATKIFDELKAVPVVSFGYDTASLTLTDVEKPEDMITFISPIKYAPITKGSNEVQSLGSTQTYLRRYLYMLLLDIIEDDTIDSGVEITPVVDEPKPEIRAELKKELTNSDGQADTLQINAIQIACQKYLEITKKSKAARDYVAQIVKDTDNLANVSKAKAEEIITELNKRVNTIPDDLPF